MSTTRYATASRRAWEVMADRRWCDVRLCCRSVDTELCWASVPKTDTLHNARYGLHSCELFHSGLLFTGNYIAMATCTSNTQTGQLTSTMQCCDLLKCGACDATYGIEVRRSGLFQRGTVADQCAGTEHRRLGPLLCRRRPPEGCLAATSSLGWTAQPGLPAPSLCPLGPG